MSKQWVVVRMVNENRVAWALGEWTYCSYEIAVQEAKTLSSLHKCRVRIFEATHDVVPAVVPPTPPPTIVRLT